MQKVEKQKKKDKQRKGKLELKREQNKDLIETSFGGMLGGGASP